MEGNQNPAERDQNTTISPVQAQAPQQTDVQPNVEPKSGSKHTLLLILLIVLVLVLVLFIYVTILNRQSSVPPVTVPSIPTAAPTPMTEEEEVNSIDVGDVDADLQEVETDLNSL